MRKINCDVTFSIFVYKQNILLFFETGPSHSLASWPETHYVAQISLQLLVVLLPQTLVFWLQVYITVPVWFGF